jgi:phosphoribosylformylglycinamidine synthase subunit PurS
MFEVKVTIMLKKGITDPEGANTLKALKLLGFNNVSEAKITRTVDMLIDGKNKEEVEKSVEQMCQRLLTNPVIHTYEIKIFDK